MELTESHSLTPVYYTCFSFSELVFCTLATRDIVNWVDKCLLTEQSTRLSYSITPPQRCTFIQGWIKDFKKSGGGGAPTVKHYYHIMDAVHV